jgi:hypothetical protein
MLQDHHIAEQRESYDAHKCKYSKFWEWNNLPLSHQQKVYMLVLKERFDNNIMSNWEKDWFKGFRNYLEKHHPTCPICGIYSLGDMCGETQEITPYAQFLFHGIIICLLFPYNNLIPLQEYHKQFC